MKNTTTNQAAAILGSVTTKAKAAAARKNGLNGGRPARAVRAMLYRNEDGQWSLSTWKGGTIPTKNFSTQKEARHFAQQRNWGVKRIKDCDAI
jgi:hypothetical protein